MINNKKLIQPLLIFPHEDAFYFVQILQRKKDHPDKALAGSNNNSRLIKAYYVTSQDKLDVYWEEMVALAELFKARISINLNPRSFRKAGFQVMQKIANQMMNGDFYSIRRAYDTVCGEYHHEIDKRWIVDIDAEDVGKLIEIEQCIHDQLNTQKGYEILSIIPSKSGYHIITNPFNMYEFSKKYPHIECHKNNPTNLFIPDSIMKT